MKTIVDYLLVILLLIVLIYQSYFLIVVAPTVVDGLILTVVPIITAPAGLIIQLLRYAVDYWRKKPNSRLMSPITVFIVLLLILSYTAMFYNTFFFVLSATLSVIATLLVCFDLFTLHQKRPAKMR